MGAVFEGGLGEILRAGGAGGGCIGCGAGGGYACVFELKCIEVIHEVEGLGDVPDGGVFGLVGDVDTGADHVEVIGESVFHRFSFMVRLFSRSGLLLLASL